MSIAQTIDQLAIYEARDDFWSFRQYMCPEMKIDWWQWLLCEELQQFFQDFVDGLKPKLVAQAPPQHGKTVTIVWFIAFMMGKLPQLKAIYTSYSESLGEDANKMLQDILTSEKYKKVFPDKEIGKMNKSKILMCEGTEPYLRNSSFVHTTVMGAITGKGLDLGIIDDPIKGRDAAGSQTIRDKTWKWFTSDFYTRFSESAGLLTILTRWHVDDPVGRMIDKWGDGIKVFSYPAIAEEDEEYRKKGEALFPSHKSLEFLLERKMTFTTEEWESLYQQNPQIVGGQVIKTKYFQYYDTLPIIKYRVIYADTAQKTKERHDYSVFQCWGFGADNRLYLIDQIRGKWEAPELKRRAMAFWNKHKVLDHRYHGSLRQMKVEDKASGTGLIQDIKRDGLIPIIGIERTKDKYTRASDILGQIEAGYVILPNNAPFLSDFVNECELFTSDDSHQHDDQVDPFIDAVNDMLASNSIARIWENL